MEEREKWEEEGIKKGREKGRKRNQCLSWGHGTVHRQHRTPETRLLELPWASATPPACQTTLLPSLPPPMSS